MPPLQPESGGTSEATNAGQLNQVMGKLIEAGSSGSAAVLTALASIASAVTASLIGGTTGVNANRILTAKGTGGFALQASGATVDSSGNINTNGGDLTVDDVTADDISAQDGAFSATLTKGGANLSVVTQVFFWSWYFPSATAKDYKMIVNSPIACTINSVTTICESGTATVTGKINTTALGGTANSVSTSEQTQTHTTSNALAVGDDFQLTPSSVSSLVGMTVTVKITVTLAAS